MLKQVPKRMQIGIDSRCWFLLVMKSQSTSLTEKLLKLKKCIF